MYLTLTCFLITGLYFCSMSSEATSILLSTPVEGLNGSDGDTVASKPLSPICSLGLSLTPDHDMDVAMDNSSAHSSPVLPHSNPADLDFISDNFPPSDSIPVPSVDSPSASPHDSPVASFSQEMVRVPQSNPLFTPNWDEVNTGAFLREKENCLGPFRISFRNWGARKGKGKIHTSGDIRALEDSVLQGDHSAFNPVHLQLADGRADVWEQLQKTVRWSELMEPGVEFGHVMHGEKRRLAMLQLAGKHKDYPEPTWWAYIYPPCKLLLYCWVLNTHSDLVFSAQHSLALAYWLNQENSGVGCTETKVSDVLVVCLDFLQKFRLVPNADKAFLRRIWENLTCLPLRKHNSKPRPLRGVNRILRHDALAASMMELMKCPLFYAGLTASIFEDFLIKQDPTVELFYTCVIHSCLLTMDVAPGPQKLLHRSACAADCSIRWRSEPSHRGQCCFAEGSTFQFW